MLWDEVAQALWWVDIHRAQVWTWAPDSDDEPACIQLDERVGAIALRQNGLALALESGFALLDSAIDAPRRVGAVETQLVSTRLNDGRVDPAGRFVCGGMDESSPQRPISAVYVLEPDLSVRPLISGISCANSICWSPTGSTLYFADMPTRRIDAYPYSTEDGSVGTRSTFVDLAAEPGLADGSAVDADGYLWNAQWGGSKVVRYAPDGTMDREIPLPVSNPTCVTFGGPDFDTLFITTAWFGLSEVQRRAQPHAGSIFALKPGVRGRPENRFAG